MTHRLIIGNEARPLRFGMAALYQYEQMTGRKALEDFAEIRADEPVRLSTIVDVVTAGLTCGYASDRRSLDFSAYDVADWIGTDEALIEQIIQLFLDSFPKADAAKNGHPPRATKANALK